MGFRFRKSFKVMPGVRVNLSSKGLSTTIGGRGASVNISKRGTYLNSGIPGTGISSRTRIGGGARSTTAASALPKTPQPASTRWFSCGVTLALVQVASVVFTYLNPTPSKKLSLEEALGFALFWAAFGAIWWYVRRSRRQAKQARYEQYVAGQSGPVALAPEIQVQQTLTPLQTVEPTSDLTATPAQGPLPAILTQKIHIGPRGGRYYFDYTGKKVYI